MLMLLPWHTILHGLGMRLFPATIGVQCDPGDRRQLTIANLLGAASTCSIDWM